VIINKNTFISMSIVFIFCVPSILGNFNTKDEIEYLHNRLNNTKYPYQELFNDNSYNPKNITPKNASYHPSKERFTIEWWYFEGIFDNGYNAVVNTVVWSKNNIGFCITHIQIFHENNTNEYFTKREVKPISRFHGSESFPDISIDGKQIIDFNQEKYNMTGVWDYNVSVDINSNSVDLNFIGLTPGWEGNTLGGYYGPVLPRAKVEGKIRFLNQIINVTGLGYHEHAHSVPFPVKEWGWYWGKIVGDNASLMWGKMMNTFWNEQARAGVFSIINSSYINIKPENIKMELFDYHFHDKRFIPTKFIFNISDPVNKIYINVTMTTVRIYHLPLGIFNYWRYLIKINGEIIYNITREKLNNKTQIIELMRFR
jgi:hypothetical protein